MGQWHAKLSASTSKRWLNCPGSVRAIQELYDEHPELKEKDEASPYAKEGTAAHHLMERCLKCLDRSSPTMPEDPNSLLHDVVDPRELVGGAVTAEGAVFGPDQVVKIMDGWHEITEDMATAVGVAVDFVLEEICRLGPGVEFFSERKWDMTWLHPDLGGTSDLTLSQFLVELCVYDYKHGKGVVVDVVDEDGNLNEQGMTYLLGAARVDDFSHEKYTIGIIQPRAPHSDGAIRTASVSRHELLQFMERLKAGAEATQDPDAPLKAGGWCKSSFCARNGNCPAQDELTSSTAKADFDDFPLEGQELAIAGPGGVVDANELARKLAWVPVIDAWCRGVETLAQRMAENGTDVPGWKLVRKKTNRKLKGETELREAAAKAGLDPLKLYQPPKIKSPAQIEKLGKAFKALVNSVDPDTKEQLYIFKPEGKVTLAAETDPRPALEPSAISDFTDLDEEESEG